MPDLQALLEEIDRLDQQATKGPWHVAPEEDDGGSKFPWAIFGPKNDLWGPQGWDHEHYIQEIPELTIPDAEFIALARTTLPQLAKAVRAVMELLDNEEEQHARTHGQVFNGDQTVPARISVNVLRLAIQNAMEGDDAE